MLAVIVFRMRKAQAGCEKLRLFSEWRDKLLFVLQMSTLSWC